MFGFNHQVRLISAKFRETGTYQPQVSRPLESRVSGQHVDHIAQVTSGGAFINPGTLASISSQILMPATQFERHIHIPSGWGTTRFRFVIELEVSKTSMSRTRKILMGYTDRAEGIMTGLNDSMDPSMVLYVNNIVTIRDEYVNGVYQSVVTENDHILSGVWDSNMNSMKDFTLRPEDVVRNMGSALAMNMFSGSDIIHDYGSTFANGIMRANRQNTAPANYLSNVINAGIHAAKTADQDLGGMSSMDQVVAGANGILMERTIHEDPVFTMMTRLGSYFQHQGCVTIGEMMSMFPEFGNDATTTVSYRNKSNYTPLVVGADAQGWDSMYTETIVASQLAHVVPSIMLDTLMGSAHFVMTNMTTDGNPLVTPINTARFQTMVEIDVIRQFQKMVSRLMTEVHPGISQNNAMPYQIEILCEPMAECQMKINIGNGEVPFVQPCFCDAITSNLVTNQQSRLASMGSDFNRLLNNVTQLVDSKLSGNSTQVFTGGSGLW